MPNPFADSSGVEEPQEPRVEHWSDPAHPTKMRIGGGWATPPPQWYRDAIEYSRQVQKLEKYPSKPIDISKQAWGTEPLETYKIGENTYARSFWENPQRVIKYKKLVDAGIAPTWVRSDLVNGAYEYLSKKYAGLPTEKWEYLPEDDPITNILRYMPAPEHPDVLSYYEELSSAEDENLSIAATGNWKNLSFAQQSLLMTVPGSVPGRGEGGEKANEWISPLNASLMMGLAAAGLSKNPIIGATVAGIVYLNEHQRVYNQRNQKIKITGDLTFLPRQFTEKPEASDIAAWSARFVNTVFGTRMTQEKWDRLSPEEKTKLVEEYNKSIEIHQQGLLGTGYDKAMDDIAKVFNFLSENAEKFVGALGLAVRDKDFATVWDAFNKNSAAYYATQLAYESGALGSPVLSAAGGQRLEKGEAWKISEGIREPVKVSYKTGWDAIDEMRYLIEAGNDPEAVLDEFRARFGVEGQINDFVYQTIMDPLNFIAPAGAGTIKKVGQVTGDVKLTQAGQYAGWDMSGVKKAVTGKGTVVKDKLTGKKVEIQPVSPINTMGRMVADVIPGGNLFAPLLTGNRIQGSSGVLGALGAYKAFLNTGGDVAPANLTKFQKILGGLTKEGLPKTTSVSEGKPKIYTNPLKWAKWMRELDPVSKAMMFSYNTMDAIARTWESVGGDINEFRRALDALAKTDPRQTGAVVDAILNPPEGKILLSKEFYNSPIAVSAGDAIGKFMASGKFDEAVSLMKLTAPNRAVLRKLTKALSVDGKKITDSEVIKLAKNNSLDVEKIYRTTSNADLRAALDSFFAEHNITPGTANDFLKTMFDPFTKKLSPVPYTEDLFGRLIAHSFYSSMGEYMAKRFGITEDPMIYRFTSALKAAQSIVLLGLNPRYMIYNEMNNIVTRIASGVFGYAKDYNKIVDRYRIDIARGDIQANFMSLGDLEGLPKGIGDRNAKAKLQIIEKFGRGAKEINKKIGVFSRMSGYLEGFESKNTFIIAFQDMFKKVFKPVLPDDLRAELNTIEPGLAQTIEFLARSGANMDEILSNIQGEWIIPEATISEVSRVYSNAHNVAGMEDVYTNMMVRSGLLDELYEEFKDLKNPTEADINRIFDDLISKKTDFASKMLDAEIDIHIEDVKARLASNNPADIQQISTEVELKHQLVRLNVLADLERVWAQKGIMTRDAFTEHLNNAIDRHIRWYDDNAKYDVATYKQLLESKGFASDDPNVLAFINSFKQKSDANSGFMIQKRQILADAFEKAKGKPDDEFYKIMDGAKAEIERLSEKAIIEEGRIQEAADNALYKVMGESDLVLEWRNHVKSVQKELNTLVKNYRADLEKAKKAARKAGNPLTPQQVNAGWSAFFFEKYFPKFTEILYAEVDGAQKVFASSTPSFKLFEEWFRGSKVVDENGNPLIVYHGTTADFDRYGEVYDLGYHFGTLERAELRAGAGEGANIRPVYLKLQNPLRLDDLASWNPIEVADAVQRADIALSEATTAMINQAKSFVDTGRPIDANAIYTSIMADIINSGYDGVIYKIIGEGLGESYVAFDRAQIRPTIETYSAIKNNVEMHPSNVAPQGTPQSQASHEMLHEHIVPYLESMRASMIDRVNKQGTKFNNLTPEQQAKVLGWARGLRQEMTDAKYASIKYAQVMRDLTMLNYQQKTNFDNVLNTVFPYQFWFTNTMRNWIMRSVDRASWYNAYFRYKQMQERLEKDGLPTRVAGKMAAPAPFLPEWMGDTVWFDPMAQIFPFSQMFQPFENFARIGSDIEHGAISILYDMEDRGEITAAQRDEAINSKSGSLWDSAFTEAAANAQTDPMTLASLMMGVGMWIDIPKKILEGNGNNIAMTPASKTSQALQTQIDAIAGKQTALGKVAGGLSWLETNIRKALGMSPAIAKYGQYGDYYIERALRDMAFTGEITIDEAIQAMITHTGEAYEKADAQVARMLSLKTPGVLVAEALRGDATALETVNSFFISFFPLGIIPQGELIMMGVQREFNTAWEVYKQTGDKTRVHELYEQYPEMAVRTALFETNPEERLKQYIIGKIEDVYYMSSAADQKVIENKLGEDFITAFVDKETRNPDAMDLRSLMIIARQLNIMFPTSAEGAETEPASEEVIEMFSEDVAKEYQYYVNSRNVLFPFWYIDQTEYFEEKEKNPDAKPGERLSEYWDWKEKFLKAHPKAAVVIEYGQTPNLAKYEGTTTADFDPLLLKSLINYYTTGESMSTGAWELLYQVWEDRGSPYGTLERWMKQEVQPSITGVAPEQESGFYLLTDKQQEIYAEYVAERDRLFPNIKETTQLYFSTDDKAERRKIVAQYPILKEYWDWDDEYEVKVPEIVEIKKIISSTYK